MAKLFWFPDPLQIDTSGLFRSDVDGALLVSTPDTHPTGRKGISWDLPVSYLNNGARVTITTPGYYDTTFRGILVTSSSLFGLLVDDSTSIKKPDVPVPPEPIPGNTPIEIINGVFATGKYNLATYDGCGQFTEACCTALHNQLSISYGHLQKIPPQNHYPAQPYVPNGKVHAVDALQLLVDTPTAKAGIYDIITSSESSSARPAFNPAGTAEPSKWYYPAK